MKKKKNNNNKFPFSNEIKLFKDDFKRSIDSMSDEEFMDMMSVLASYYDCFDDENWTFDEGFFIDAFFLIMFLFKMSTFLWKENII